MPNQNPNQNHSAATGTGRTVVAPEAKAKLDIIAERVSENLLACAIWLQKNSQEVDYHSDSAFGQKGERVACLKSGLAGHMFTGTDFLDVVTQAMDFEIAWTRSVPKFDAVREFLGLEGLLYPEARIKLASMLGPIFQPGHRPRVAAPEWRITAEKPANLTGRGQAMQRMNLQFNLDAWRDAKGGPG